ncbi:MAG TPA: hypothetical protein PK095_09255, partial [Myxococcota bacterium]|nr:hypothetical protein [Myxococcota bacterium]
MNSALAGVILAMVLWSLGSCGEDRPTDLREVRDAETEADAADTLAEAEVPERDGGEDGEDGGPEIADAAADEG